MEMVHGVPKIHAHLQLTATVFLQLTTPRLEYSFTWMKVQRSNKSWFRTHACTLLLFISILHESPTLDTNTNTVQTFSVYRSGPCLQPDDGCGCHCQDTQSEVCLAWIARQTAHTSWRKFTMRGAAGICRNAGRCEASRWQEWVME